MNYKHLMKKPQVFRRLFGIPLDEFNKIVEKCYPLWQERIEDPKKVSGRPYVLEGIEEHVLCLLLYYRSYITHAFLGVLFGVDDSVICRSFRRIEPILALVMSLKKVRYLSKEEVASLIIDCTEQPMERPKKKQRKYYSGKKKRHTLKTEIQITEDGRIVSVSKPYPGKIHDIEVRKRGSPLAKESTAYVDSGYQGLHKVHAATEYPYKRSKNHPLTKEEKQYNQGLSRFRVRVENKIAELKKFKILSDRYRNKRRGYGIKFNIIAGIVNLNAGF